MLIETQGAARIAVGLPEAGSATARLAKDPPRLVVDLPFDRWRAPPLSSPKGGLISSARVGQGPDGRARLVVDLTGPARLEDATLVEADGGRHFFRLRLTAADAPPSPAAPPFRAPVAKPATAPDGDGPRPLVMIDPGHGGRDPGAVRGDVLEKSLAFAFALDLKAALEASGRWRVAMTREGDRFLPLDARVAAADAAGASVMLSIHANTVERGDAEGASLFTLASHDRDPAADAMAAAENRDMEAPVPPPGDPASRALLRIARSQSMADSRRLGDDLATALGVVTPMLRGRAHMQANFRVLTSSHTPSALVELGFMTNAEDLARLQDPGWRARVAGALTAGLELWRHRAAGLSSARFQR